jgi:hypothetical protein
MLGVESWKPALGALLLPPTPFALMVLAGGVVMARRRLVGWVLLFAGALGTWFMCTAVAGQALTELPLMPTRPLSPHGWAANRAPACGSHPLCRSVPA